MIVQIGDTVYNFIFMHVSSIHSTLWSDTTICQVFNISDEIEDPIWSGSAFCSYKDTFDKGFGKMLSLKRALTLSDFDRGSRAYVWAKFKTKNENVR